MKKYFTLIILLSFVYFVKAQTEINVTFQSGGLTLYGTLALPPGNGPFPVTVFVHGSGPQDREQTTSLNDFMSQCTYPGLHGTIVSNFLDLTEAFNEYGMAVLKFDKRTYTYQGQLDPETISMNDFILDINNAIDFVKTRVEVDPSRVFLLAHSKGTNIIPLVAAQRDDIKALISLAAPAHGIDSIIAEQIKHLYKVCLNNDTAGGNMHAQQLLEIFLQIRADTFPNAFFDGVPVTFWQEWINITDSAVINYNRINHPVLLLQGTDDFQVKVDEAYRFQQGITRPGVDIYILDSLNHFMTPYNIPNVAKVVPDTIFHWLKEENLHTATRKNPVHQKVSVRYINNQFIMLDIPENIQIEKIIMIDMQGRNAKVELVHDIIDLSSLVPGIYSISVITRNGVLTSRVLKR